MQINSKKNKYILATQSNIMQLIGARNYIAVALIFSFAIGSVAAASFEFTAINVGQGDAIYVKSPSGKHILIDCGDNGQGGTVLNYLKGKGVSHIDYLVASHYHADHIGGCDEVLNSTQVTVGEVDDRGGSYDSQSFRDYVAAAGAKRKIIGDSLDFGQNATAKVLQKDFGTDENGKSIVVKFTFNKLEVLSGGDCTEACETNLINTNSPGDIEVYKVHHHGSKYSSSQGFLNVILPEVSIISVGPNSYGHPAPETLGRLKAIGSAIYRTEKNGNVALTSEDGLTYKVLGKKYIAR